MMFSYVSLSPFQGGFMPTISQALASHELAASHPAVPTMVNYPSLWSAANAAAASASAGDKEYLVVPRRRALRDHSYLTSTNFVTPSSLSTFAT